MKHIYRGAFLLVIGMASCKKEEEQQECASFSQSPVSWVSGRDTGFANLDTPIPVEYIGYDGCGRPGYFEAETRGRITTVRAIGKYICAGCTQSTIRIRDTFHFKAADPGTYFLIFDTMRGYLADTVVVQ